MQIPTESEAWVKKSPDSLQTQKKKKTLTSVFPLPASTLREDFKAGRQEMR